MVFWWCFVQFICRKPKRVLVLHNVFVSGHIRDLWIGLEDTRGTRGKFNSFGNIYFSARVASAIAQFQFGICRSVHVFLAAGSRDDSSSRCILAFDGILCAFIHMPKVYLRKIIQFVSNYIWFSLFFGQCGCKKAHISEIYGYLWRPSWIFRTLLR